MNKNNKKRIIGALGVTTGVIAAFKAVTALFVKYSLSPKKNTVEVNADAPFGEEERKQEAKKIGEWLENAKKKRIIITSKDNLSLSALEIFPKEESHKYVILIHGYNSAGAMMYDYAKYYVDAGYTALVCDLRSHGESEGKYIGMGWLDRKDILLWIDKLVKKDSDCQIVIHGISMGAATTMMVTGEDLPSQVKAAVEDCGYTSVHDIFGKELKCRFHLPKFPFLYMASHYSKRNAGYGFKEASALAQIKKSAIPIMFIHGSEDTFVPKYMAYELYEAANCQKTLWIVEGAAHANSFYKDRDKYFKKVFEFLNRYVK